MFRRKKQEAGQALVLLVLGIVGLIALTGLAIDGGMAMADRRDAQNAADNAAMAAAMAIAQDSDPYTAAYNVAADNGYDNNGTDNTVTIDISTELDDVKGDVGSTPTHNAAYFQNNNEFYIRVTIESSTQTGVSKVVGKDSVDIQAHAISHVRKGRHESLYGGRALVVLSPHENDSFHHHKKWGTLEIHGHVTLDIEDSGIFVNSDSEQAVTIGGGGSPNHDPTTVNTDTGIAIVGGAYFKPGTKIDGYTISESNPYPPTVTFGVPQQPLPPDFSFIPAPPAPPSCSGLPTITKSEWNNYPDGAHVTLQPGNYVNGITIQGGVDEVTMESGVYCVYDHMTFNGGPKNITGGDVKIVPQDNFDLTINGGSVMDFDGLEYYPEDGDLIINGGSTLNADHFRFYARGSASFEMKGHGGDHRTGETFTSGDAFFYVPEGTVIWHGGANLDMHAPPEDDPNGYGGLLIYKPWGNTVPVKLHGGTGINFVGSLIMPNTDLIIHGHTDVEALDTQIVAYTVIIHGHEHMHIQFHETNQYQAPIPPLVELLQ